MREESLQSVLNVEEYGVITHSRDADPGISTTRLRRASSLAGVREHLTSLHDAVLRDEVQTVRVVFRRPSGDFEDLLTMYSG